MKQSDVLKLLAREFKVSASLEEVNKALKSKDAPKTKFRMTGKKLGHYGFTGLLKAVTADGVKVFDVNKVKLIPLDAIETFEKAKPREKRAVVAKPVPAKGAPKPTAAPASMKAKMKAIMEDDEDEDDDDDFDDEDFDDVVEAPVKKRRKGRGAGNSGGTGSKYIPGK